MKIFILAASIALIQTSGCSNDPQPKPTMELRKPLGPMVRRFESVPTAGSQGIALDTVTGQWCRTWEWTPRDLKPAPDIVGSLPSCLTLFKTTPAETSPLDILQTVK